jgi:hypothetical protein
VKWKENVAEGLSLVQKEYLLKQIKANSSLLVEFIDQLWGVLLPLISKDVLISRVL